MAAGPWIDHPAFDTVSAPLVFWAARRPHAVALASGERTLSFETLAQMVADRARRVTAERRPAIAWVADTESQAERLADFLGIVESGRAAAIADPDWPAPIRAEVEARLGTAGAEPGPPHPDCPFYVGFTSGSTGLPKGFVRDHRSWTESFRLSLTAFGARAEGPVVAPGRLSHSLFLFAMLLGLWTGAGVTVQDRFSAPRCLDLLQQSSRACLVAVPSQLMLLLEAAARRGQRPIAGVALLLVSGARWTRALTPRLRALFPEARVIEFYGASETSFIAWTESDPALPETLVGQPFPEVELKIQGEPPGLIFVRSPMLFSGYALGDDGGLLRDGEWISVRDVGFLDNRGALYLLGREQRMIVTQGKKSFPEEVGKRCSNGIPPLRAASVFGVPDALRGTRLVADLAVTLFSLLALWTFAEMWQQPNRKNVALFGLSLAGALLSKFALAFCSLRSSRFHEPALGRRSRAASEPA